MSSHPTKIMATRQRIRHNVIESSDEEIEVEKGHEAMEWVDDWIEMKSQEEKKKEKEKKRDTEEANKDFELHFSEGSDEELHNNPPDEVSEHVDEIVPVVCDDEPHEHEEEVLEVPQEVIEVDTAHVQKPSEEEINIVRTDDGDIENFFTQNKNILKTINLESKYSVYKFETADTYQTFINIWATEGKLEKKSKSNKTVLKIPELNQEYQKWKKNKFNQDELIPKMEKALKVVQADMRRSRGPIQKEVKTKQISLFDAFGKTKNKSKKTSENNVQGSSSSDTDVTLVPDDQPHVQKPSTSAPRESNSSVPVTATIFDGFHFESYQPSEVISEEIDSRKKAINDFRTEASQFFKNRKYILNKEFSARIKECEKKIDSVTNTLKKADIVEKETSDKLIGKSVGEKKRIILDASTKITNLETILLNELIQIEPEDVKKLVLDLRKRNQTKQSQKAQKQKNQQQTTKKRATTFKAKNGSKTWSECMDIFEEKEEIEYKSTKLAVGEAWMIRTELQSKEERCLSKEEVACLLNKPLAEADDLVDCLVDNLPVISVKRGDGQSRVYEAKEFLKDPVLMVKLWNLYEESLNNGSQEIEQEIHVVHPTRKPGSGLSQEHRRKVTPEIAEEVKRLIAYAGMPAHERRRDDRSHFGGQGAGVTWKGHVYPFVVRHFFNNDSSKISTTTVRRAGLPPNRNVTSASRYRGLIKAKPCSALNNKALGDAHKNAHYCATVVNYSLEFSALNSDYCTVISVDDKAK